MADDVRIRPVRGDEAVELIDFWKRSGENDGRPVDTVDAVLRLVERDAEALVVAVRGSRVVGSLIIGWDGWRFHLYRLAVDPGERRSGIAKKLLAYAEARAQSVGAGRIDAMVLEANASGAAFWQAAGFRSQEEWRRWVRAVPDKG